MKKLNWNPILKDDVYCSSACGLGCKHKWFKAATKNAEWLCKQLPGFKPYVHENMGWFWKAKKANITVSPMGYFSHGERPRKCGYFAGLGDGILSEGKTPKAALLNMYKHFAARAHVNIANRDYLYKIIKEMK